MLFLCLSLYLSGISLKLFSQQKPRIHYSCDDQVVLNSSVPKAEYIQGFHLFHKSCIPGMVVVSYAKSPDKSLGVLITIMDSDPGTLNQATVKFYAPQILGMKLVVQNSIKLGKYMDSLVAAGNLPIGSDPLRLATTKIIRGQEVAVILDSQPNDDLGFLALIVKDRYIIKIELLKNTRLGHNHDQLIEFLSPFLNAIYLEGLEN